MSKAPPRKLQTCCKMTNTKTSEGTAGNGQTVECLLEGGTRATAATCTGTSAIPGLGTEMWTSTLASTQISYAPITITAGAEKLTTVPKRIGGSDGNSTRAAGVGTTPDVRWALGCLLAVAVIVTL